jgi:hypothetical protein
MGRPPKNAVPPPDSSALFELLIQVTLPDKRVRQRGGKTKSEKQEPIKRGPLEIDISIGWVELMEMVAELIQVAPASLVVETFEWHWLKPASSGLVTTDGRARISIVDQAGPYKGRTICHFAYASSQGRVGTAGEFRIVNLAFVSP